MYTTFTIESEHISHLQKFLLPMVIPPRLLEMTDLFSHYRSFEFSEILY